MELTYKDVQSILKIIDEASHLDEIELSLGNFRLHVVRNGAGTSVARAAPRPAPAAEPVRAPASAAAPRAPNTQTPADRGSASMAVPEGLHAIRAPMMGTFYRAPAPGEKPFVEVGQRVGANDNVCLIEVMKLFNTIKAGVDGEVVQIVPANATLVEFDQPMILIRPNAGR